MPARTPVRHPVAVLVGCVLALSSSPLAAQGDAAAGEQLFGRCAACHSLEPGQVRVGPSLRGIIGRKAGSQPDYTYSVVMRRSDLTWTRENLDRFIEAPSHFMHGTKMIFSGMRSPEERAAIIAYLEKAGGQAASPTAAAPRAPGADAAQRPAAGQAPAASRPAAGGAQQSAADPHAAHPTTDMSVPAGYTAQVRYTLRTGIAEGRMVYIGVGGDIDGVINPPLSAMEGQVVQVTLINGEGAEHDIVFHEQNIASQHVTGRGASTTVAFRARAVGDFTYFCSLPGHRLAGMEGKFTVRPATAPSPPVAGGANIALDPTRLPPPTGRTQPTTVQIELESVELEGRLADGTTYTYWTFNSTVPGPFLRVRVGDTVEVTLRNNKDAAVIHSIDFHAATAPGGGAEDLQVEPGGMKKIAFKALKPGLFVYHCATPLVAHHIANGMYGLILVEPEEGLPPVDHEYYVMQGEVYTAEPYGQSGSQEFSIEKLLREQPEYFVFNGNVGSLTESYPLKARVGETVRLFFGNGGPNFTSSFHVIGEIFDKVYAWADLVMPAAQSIQTVSVPPGGAVVTEFRVDYPGKYIMVDHALSRVERGLAGHLVVEGEADHSIFRAFRQGAGDGSGGH